MNRLVFALPVTLFATFSVSAAESVPHFFNAPTFDQWVYPFNPSPGSSDTASTFSSNLPDGFPSIFDNRDGQMLVMFDTSGVIETGLDASAYDVSNVVVTVMIQNDNGFTYDPTPDSYTSWLLPSNRRYVPDSDAGHPIEMFGTGFRNGYTPLTYTENAPYSFVGPFGKAIRNSHPIAFNSPAADLDASNSVDLMFDPVNFAVGLTDEVAPGSPVPAGTTFTFTIDLSNPDVKSYVQESLATGRLYFTIASLFQTEQQGSTGYPRIFTKENQLVIDELASPASLTIDVRVNNGGLVGDLNGDGIVDGADLGLLLAAWDSDDADADLNGDGTVDGADLGLLLANWTL